uniref:Uncharacterized protein n=1 Tax=viral metagenome TaxID=1070528 RepID=A0A6C0JEB9_9ZZZZ
MPHLSELPECIVYNCIFDFIPDENLIWINKTYYKKNGHLIKKMVPIRDFESYIRSLVKNDNYFCLEHIVYENIDRWNKMKRYKYRYMLFYNYLHFIYCFAKINGSMRCVKLIDDIAREKLSLKWHKKYSIKDIRRKWSN